MKTSEQKLIVFASVGILAFIAGFLASRPKVSYIDCVDRKPGDGKKIVVETRRMIRKPKRYVCTVSVKKEESEKGTDK